MFRRWWLAGATNNLFDRHPRPGRALNDGIVSLAAKKSFVLAPLGVKLLPTVTPRDDDASY
jgi:hypothetical protein